ncbi:MAG: hypothetical protein WB812_08210, partial [Woeseiaceae bacterium]
MAINNRGNGCFCEKKLFRRCTAATSRPGSEASTHPRRPYQGKPLIAVPIEAVPVRTYGYSRIDAEISGSSNRLTSETANLTKVRDAKL